MRGCIKKDKKEELPKLINTRKQGNDSIRVKNCINIKLQYNVHKLKKKEEVRWAYGLEEGFLVR
jgi:hypothetical protein